MKMKASTGRKLRYGGVSAALTALIIAIVIIANIIFSTLTQKFMWYVDLTPDLLYTLSDEALSLIEKDDEEFGTVSPVKMVDSIREEKAAADENYDPKSDMINIIFCDEPDALTDNSSQRYVYHTALELQDKFPDYIHVETRDIIRNPSSVSEYKTNSMSTIYTTSVIIEFGTEFRVREIRSFFTFNDSSDDTPWAYNGEKAFISSILAVTRAESPVACIVRNHGEDVFTYKEFYQTLFDAGYVVQYIDLAAQEIPEKCRLLVVFDPTEDFLVKDGISEIDEIEKIDKFLDGTNSMMVFMDPDTERLENFESYLEEWGISFDRHTDAAGKEISHLVMDKTQSLTVDGYTFKAEYVTAGNGASLTEDMRSRPVAQSIIFKNAMSISYSELYAPTHYTPQSSSSDEQEFDYGSYNKDGVSRNIYDVFVTSSGAEAYAGSTEPVEKASDNNKLKLMTISEEARSTQESNYSTISEASYVLACGSTEFASNDLLQSGSYGNTDVLLTALRSIGREPVPVGLMPKPFADSEIDTVTTSESVQYILVLTLVPLLAASITGVVIIVRRKNR